MTTANIKAAMQATQDVFGNGRFLLLVVMSLGLVGITILGLFHDVDSNAITAIYTALIAGAVGHANGNLQGRLAAERENLLAQVADAKRQAGS